MIKKPAKLHSKRWIGVSPWVIIGAVFILVPVFIFMTQQSLDRQRAHTTKLLEEKGAALIRSFEAGARTGVGLRWGPFQLQKLLMEMAQQPDIDYLIVTDVRGVILADSDPSLIGETYGADLDLERLSRSNQTRWRQVPNTEGADTFEIYRQFKPVREDGQAFQDRIGSDQDPASRKDNAASLAEGMVIFVGLDMGPVEAARKEDNRHTIMMAVIFLLISMSGIISLMLAQGYRSAQTSLSRVRAFSDNLVKHMPMGLAAIDGTGRITAFNETAASILRQNAAGAVGRRAEEVLPGDFREMIRAMELEKGVAEREIEYRMAEGSVIPLDVMATALEGDESGREVVILFRDVTEIRQLKNEIARSRRLASLGSLAAGVAHEIRNPLSSIKGFATYFKERYRDNPEDGRTADIMVQEVDRLNRVIGQLLDYARPMTMNRQETPVQVIVRHALRMIENEAREKGIAVAVELPEDLAPLRIDPDRIKQVLLNLFLNALGAMEKGGVLSVLLSELPDRLVRLEVRDTGTGIDAKDLERIFDPYFTTKPSGTGLGLAIVQKIVEAHGGAVHVSSAPGRGATVTVLLPRSGG
jgi:two-component system sensor histidine kinase HydH